MILFIIIIQLSASAYEVDNFTSRKLIASKPDATAMINEEVNNRIKAAVSTYNKEENCTKDFQGTKPELLSYISDAMGGSFRFSLKTIAGGSFSSGVENAFDEDKKYETYRFPVPQPNIYTDTNAFLKVTGTQPSLRIGNNMMGVDKIGHFFAQGKQYFDQIIPDSPYKPFKDRIGKPVNLDVSPALKFGLDMENGNRGLVTTGVKSYGDLSANFQGLRFWTNLLMGPKPYLSCNTAGKLVINPARPFSFKEYFSPAFDEGINCSQFEEKITEKMHGRIAALGGCPANPKQCEMIGRLPCAAKLVSPDCKDDLTALNPSCVLNNDLLTESIEDQVKAAPASCKLINKTTPKNIPTLTTPKEIKKK